MRAEKLMRKVIYLAGTYLLAGGLLLPVMVEAATSATATVQVTIYNPRPTCDLTMNGKSTLQYPLGSMTPGTQKAHTPIMVKVTCQDNRTVKTAVTVKPGGNTVLQPGNDSVRIPVAGSTGVDNNSPLLWLQAKDGKRVKLTGLESDAFCIKADTSQTAPNECSLTPVTNIPARSALGNFGATMLMEVVYPL